MTGQKAPPRVIVLWCADWPVTAALDASSLPPDAPIALIDKGVVVAASAAARHESVKRGLRVREAQARCPDLVVQPYDADRDARLFEPLVASIEELTPAATVLRPGLCAVRVRGVARYFGGERPAALALVSRLVEHGGGLVRAGVADGIFTAELAARRAANAVELVEAGGAAGFLAPLDIGVLEEGPVPEVGGIVTLLRRLGIRTLAQFAALDASDVSTRFGVHGARLHALAAGSDSHPLVPRDVPDDIHSEVVFEPALELVDQVAFGMRQHAERFVDELLARRLVCTAILVRLESDAGQVHERTWLHPRSFSPADIVDRVRWQATGAEFTAGITRVVVLPDAVDAVQHHEAGLWGAGPDERIHHGLSRVQGLLGHEAVLVPTVGGGRTLADRQHLVAWGDRPVGVRQRSAPWPGRLPSPLPATVFVPRHAVHVVDERDESVAVDARGRVSASLVRMTSGSRTLDLTAWSGPWPVDERWWAPEQATRSWRFQVVDATGCGWLLVLDGDGWWAEARYD
ncbi:protein ImuB [Microbacteriaceae bacterium SG_E_30_P1]|uniref:Protein ImuB n=1 Tax=Antiquaquibacter oligotrophicus TaxID=2880260 RepID=A0ABT6KP08_9MICO|nr:DNA polymerase Y family protein [Antiquaquibacter oligotrophicus]MDH6180887.1 protein ImuB [Antiquaquibacter oligotrophicus]UDF13406.1 DNA polymerase Y family protein [Antiquaquibacter oligotrophicus]